ncbi:MAG: 7-carboxy-7-deazaguanine synthase QueE [Gammaproteobacteria bacterium]|nr:7-carboxy-7-deazaguanine synthase QueE [Gammaproteobacteria bacterium]
MLKPVQYDVAADTLRITEIFYSLQGESRTVGWPTVFVRLTGCPLRCNYCDSEYAFSGGEDMALDAILAQVESYSPHYVCVTGGEPLAQRASLNLLTRLCDVGYEVSLETSGALDIAPVDPRVILVMDMKTPSSNEEEKNLLHNLALLHVKDQLKFVIADRADYDWACALVKQHMLEAQCEVLFSPVHGALAAQHLAQWILEDRLQVRFQLQLHKILWGEEPGR